jgi:hypothetical protein
MVVYYYYIHRLPTKGMNPHPYPPNPSETRTCWTDTVFGGYGYGLAQKYPRYVYPCSALGMINTSKDMGNKCQRNDALQNVQTKNIYTYFSIPVLTLLTLPMSKKSSAVMT